MTETEASTPEAQTCGKGLAAHAPLPAALGRLTAAVADVLEAHVPMLDLSDPNATLEHTAYRQLVEDHRRTAALLEATAERMSGYRDLPMGRHMDVAGADSRIVASFARFVALEDELRMLLEQRLGQDREMLQAMRRGGDTPG
jgi:hypothetical protein